MAMWVVMGALAAFGLLCSLWMLLGWLISGGEGGCVVCICRSGGGEAAFIRRSLWLKGLGLLRGPILLVNDRLQPREAALLGRFAPDAILCSPEELFSWLEVERERIGGTGT